MGQACGTAGRQAPGSHGVPWKLDFNCQTFSTLPHQTISEGGGVFHVQGKLNLQILARQEPRHFFKMSEKITQGWQKVLMRNSERLLLCPGGLSW